MKIRQPAPAGVRRAVFVRARDFLDYIAEIGGLLVTVAVSLLPDSGKYIRSATMWAGRVGTVTLAAALAMSQRRQLFTTAEERIIVG